MKHEVYKIVDRLSSKKQDKKAENKIKTELKNNIWNPQKFKSETKETKSTKSLIKIAWVQSYRNNRLELNSNNKLEISCQWLRIKTKGKYNAK